jgi:O-methyltransferase
LTRNTVGLDLRIETYIRTCSLREPEVLERLRLRTADLPEADMQIAPEQGQFMALLVKLIGAERILEIGCFTGYSALWMALAQQPHGRVITLDVNDDWAALGRAAWREAGVEDRVELRLGPALASLDLMLAEGAAGAFDLAFIDADKKSYDIYYERALTLVRPGGLILLDNMLWGGTVADPKDTSHQAETLRRLAAKLQRDERVDLAFLPLADGLVLARKR